MENKTHPRSRSILLLPILLLCAVSLFPAQAGSASSDVLLQSNNLTYVGAIRLPRLVDSQGKDFDFGGSGLAFYPAHNSLFVNNHNYDNLTVEIGIPAVLGSTQTLNGITAAPVLQGYADVTEGHLGDIRAGGAHTSHPMYGGSLVYNNRFIGNNYEFYDADNSTRLSHFTHSLTIGQTGTYQGMYLVGDPTRTGYVSGYMTQIPADWQAALGGPAFTGNCCLNNDQRSSLRASVSVFNPDDLGHVDPVPVTEVLSLDLAHSIPSDLTASHIGGVVFPAGTRTVLFFGRRGAETGHYCYGEQTFDPTLQGQPVPDEPGDIYCYDPAESAKGGHDYPYTSAVWAYNVEDLVAVKNGTKHPWEVLPYARWDLTSFPSLNSATIMGAAYDPATQRIYITQSYGEQAYPKEVDQYNARPLIQIFQVNNAAPIPTPVPPPIPTPLPVSPEIVTLNVGSVVPLNARISATYSGSDSAPIFAWRFTPTTAAHASLSVPAAISAPDLTTPSPQANLGLVPLSPGTYIISVQVLNGTTILTQTQANVTLVPTDLSSVRVYPNPWRSDKNSAKPFVLFNDLTVNTTIKIFTVSGHWIKTLPVSSTSVSWDLTNDTGNNVASGIYVYILSTDQGQKKTGQIVVIK